jgi:hypothetical protein
MEVQGNATRWKWKKAVAPLVVNGIWLSLLASPRSAGSTTPGMAFIAARRKVVEASQVVKKLNEIAGALVRKRQRAKIDLNVVTRICDRVCRGHRNLVTRSKILPLGSPRSN